MDLQISNKLAIVTGASRGIGRAVAFLASPQTASIQGAILDGDGGAPHTL